MASKEYQLCCDNVAAVMERWEESNAESFIKSPRPNCSRLMAQEIYKNSTAQASCEDLLEEIEDSGFRNMVRDEFRFLYGNFV